VAVLKVQRVSILSPY